MDAEMHKSSAAAATAAAASATLLNAMQLERLQLCERHLLGEGGATLAGLSCKQFPAGAVAATAAAAAPAAAVAATAPLGGLNPSRQHHGDRIIVSEAHGTGEQVDTAAAAAATASAAAATVPSTVPLQGLKLSSQEPLRSATRQKCPSCGKPRAFFCYDCLIPLMSEMPQLPSLPVTIHIVMHGETNAQATGTHAAVLAPQCVTLWRHNDGTSHHRRQPASKLQLPDWDPQTTAVLFPAGPDTPVVGLWGRLQQQQQQQQQQGHDQVAAAATGSCSGHAGGQCTEKHLALQSCSSSSSSSRCSDMSGTTSSCSCRSSLFPYTAVVILEGNWAKARTLLKHPKIAPLPCIQLPPHVRSLFWRRGTGSFRAAVDCGVCTIEALYLLCRQLQPEPSGQWDDLLWLWLYQRELVQRMGSYQTRQEMQQNFEAACGSKLEP